MKRSASLKDSLDSTIERIGRIDPSELELRADFSRYLCVLVSGFLEQSMRNASAEYARKRAHPSIANFVAKTTGRISNLSAGKLKEHLLMFEPSWQGELDLLLADEVKDAIDSIVALRHGIAHGQPADVTFERVVRYYSEVVKTVNAIQALMDVDP